MRNFATHERKSYRECRPICDSVYSALDKKKAQEEVEVEKSGVISVLKAFSESVVVLVSRSVLTNAWKALHLLSSTPSPINSRRLRFMAAN